MDVRYPDPPPGDDGNDVDGPPPPPFVRERRRRRRRRLIAAGVALGLVVLAIPAMAVGGWLAFQEDGPTTGGAMSAPDGTGGESGPSDSGNGADEPSDGGDDGGDGGSPGANGDDGGSPGEDPDGNGNVGADGRPDRDVPPDQRIGPPDLERIGPGERRLGELLLDIDAAERAMLHYQQQVRDALTGDRIVDEPEELTQRVREAARAGLRDLDALRSRLQREQRDPTAESVRRTYLGHLEAWVSYLEAVDEDPQILFRDLTRFDVDINRTGDDFVRAVDDLLESNPDADLGRYVDAIVERGFSGPETPQV